MKKASIIILQLFCLVVFLSISANAQTNCRAQVLGGNSNFPSSGGVGSFTVSIPFNCDLYLDARHNTWIDRTGLGSSRSGNTATIFFRVQANIGAERTGSIRVGGTSATTDDSFTITQAAAPCEYSVSPTFQTVGSGGGAGTFNVVTQSYCEWSVQSVPTWIAINSGGGTRAGNGTVHFTAQTNTGQARTGTIAVGNQTFTVNQDAFAAPVEYLMATGQVVANNRPVRDAVVTFTANGETLTTRTNHSGYFRLTVQRNQAYNVTISHKRYKFSGTQSVSYNSSNFVVIFAADQE